METSVPPAHRRWIVERSVAAVLVAAFALATFVLVRRAREDAALALAAERLMAGDAVAAARLLPPRGDGRARAGRALAGALSGEGPESCACAAEDLAFFHPALVVEGAIRRAEREGALRVARLARQAGGPAMGVVLAAALVEAGHDDEARAALAAVPEPERWAGLGREAARVLELHGHGAVCIVRDRGRRLAGTLDASGRFEAVPEAAGLVPPAVAAGLAAAGRVPGLRLATDLALSRFAREALGSYRISCNVAFANLGLKVGGPALVEEFRRWGFDGREPGDGRIVHPPQGALPLAKMAVGLDATDITPLHAARLAAVAAGGEMPEPQLVAATDGALGLTPRTRPYPAARRILDAPAAEVLRHAMEAVTQPGHRPADLGARIPGRAPGALDAAAGPGET